jgi:hypothetical protein
MGELDRDVKEPRVPEVVLDRVVTDVLLLRKKLSANYYNVTEAEQLAWTAAAMPALIEAEQRHHWLSDGPNFP